MPNLHTTPTTTQPIVEHTTQVQLAHPQITQTLTQIIRHEFCKAVAEYSGMNPTRKPQLKRLHLQNSQQ